MKTISGLINEGILKGGIPQVIDLLPGQYLSDVIKSITDASETKPYTINFYNHSKTVNWDTFTAKIHVPEYVNINFVGNINWWNKFYYPRMGFDEGLTDVNWTDKLFIGFSFDRSNDDDFIRVSGLPMTLQKVFFGGLDSAYQEASEYQDLLDDPEDWGFGTLGLVRVKGSKGDDIRNNALYKKIGTNFIDVTPDFQYVDFNGNYLQFSYFYAANCQAAYFVSANCQAAYFVSANCQAAYFNSANCQSADFYSANCQSADFNSANCQAANFNSANCQGAYFGSANCQSADFDSANLKNVSWNEVTSIVGANFRNADLTGGANLPERINTKAKWIAECGAGKVNAETIWIDGTSILS